MHSGPSNLNRFSAGGTGTLFAVIILWLLREYGGVEPPPEVSDAMAGVIVVVFGAIYSKLGGLG